MAKPIEATPILTGKEAEQLLKELEKPVKITAKKKKELKGYLSAYEHFVLRSKNCAA